MSTWVEPDDILDAPIPTGRDVFDPDDVVTPDDPVVAIDPSATVSDLELEISKSDTPDLERARVGNALFYQRLYGIPAVRAYEEQDGYNEYMAKGPVGEVAFFDYLKEGWDNGITSNESGELGYRMFWGDETKATADRVKELQAAYKPESEGWKKWYDIPARAARYALEQLPLLVEGFTEGGAKGTVLAGGFAGAAAVGTLPLQGAVGPGTAAAAVSVVGAAQLGFGIGMTEGTLENIFRKETGNAYIEFGDIKDANGQPLSKNARKAAALAAGTISTALETLQITKVFPGLTGRIRNKAIQAAAKGLFSRVQDVSAETLQEVLQESATILAGELARDIQEIAAGVPQAARDALTTENLKKAIPRVLDVGAKSLLAFLGIGAVKQGAQMVKGAVQQRAVVAPEVKKAPISAAEFDDAISDLKAVVESAEAVDDPVIQEQVAAIQETVVELEKQRTTLATAETGKAQAVEFTQAIKDDTTLNNVLQQVQAAIVENPKVEVDAVTKSAAESSVSQQISTTQADAVREQWASDPLRYRKLAGFETAAGLDMLEFDYADRLTVAAEDEMRGAFKKANKMRREAQAIKGRVREITGQTRVSDLIQEPKALQAAFKKSEQGSKAGKRAGKAEEHASQMDIRKRIDSRRKLRQEVRQIQADLRKASENVGHMSQMEGDAAREALASVDLVISRPAAKMEKLRSLYEFLSDPETDVEMPERVLDRLAILDKKPLGEFTIDDLRALHASVMAAVHVSDKMQTIRHRTQKMKRERLARDARAELKPAKQLIDETKTSPSPLKAAKDFGNWMKAQGIERQTQYWAYVEGIAGPNSVVDTVLVREIEDGRRVELATQQELRDGLHADIAATGMDKLPASWLNEKVPVGRWKEFTHAQRMAIYRISLHEQNRADFLEGFVIRHSEHPNLIRHMTEGELDAIVDSLTPEELAIAGKPVTNFFKNLGQKMADVHYQKNGFPLEMVDNHYYPIDTVPQGRGKTADAEEAIQQFRQKWWSIGLQKGMLKERTGATVPIYLNDLFYDMNQALVHGSAYVGLEMPLSDASKLFNDIKYDIENRYGETARKEIEQGLRDISRAPKNYNSFEKWVIKRRKNVTLAMLGPRPTFLLKQPISWAMYSPFVGYNHLLEGTFEFIRHPKMVMDELKKNSPHFRDRVEKGFTRETEEVISKPSLSLTEVKKVPERMMKPSQWLDNSTVAPGMWGARNKVLQEMHDGKLSPEVAQGLNMTDAEAAALPMSEKMKAAYRYADYATARSQTSTLPEYQSPMARGTVLEQTLLTHFGSSTNSMLNMTMRAIREAVRGGPGAKRFAALAISAVIFNMLGDVMVDGFWEKMRDKKSSFAGRVLKSTAGMMFGIREVVRGIVNKVERGWAAGDIQFPLMRIPNLMVRAGADWIEAWTADGWRKRDKALKRAVDESAEIIGSWNGFPYAPLRDITVTTVEKLKE